MGKYREHLKDFLRHKRLVIKYGRRLGVGWWQLLTHDFSKLSPHEWFAYTDFLFGGAVTLSVEEAFKRACNHHYHSNPHHWNYWLMIKPSALVNLVEPLEIPEKYLREMWADWLAASHRKAGMVPIHHWWNVNKESVRLHPISRAKTEEFIKNWKYG